MEYCGSQVWPCPDASWPRSTISFASSGVSFDRLTDHVRCDLNADAIPHIEHARNAFFKTIFVPLPHGQIGALRIKRRKGAAGSAFRLSASFKLHGDGDDKSCLIRPEGLSWGVHGFLSWS